MDKTLTDEKHKKDSHFLDVYCVIKNVGILVSQKSTRKI